MRTGENVKISPEITGFNEWVTGKVIDVEKNPFNGIIIAAKDNSGRIFFDKEEFFRSEKEKELA
jgi:hypothetical protein